MSKVHHHYPERRLHRGCLRDLYNLTQNLSNDECPPLNAISLPAYRRNLYIPPQFGSFASHEVAQSRLPERYEAAFAVPDVKPRMEWSLIGSRGTVSPLHVDSEGLGTAIVVLEGSKYWIVATRFGEQEIICSLDSLGPTWNPYFINNGRNAERYRFEGVHLQKGDMLYVSFGISSQNDELIFIQYYARGRASLGSGHFKRPLCWKALLCRIDH